jgi:hypothetical protein
MSLLRTLSSLEENDSIHTGRLLILLSAFATEDGRGKIEGLTKLAKLDFLLRYPVCFERALTAKGITIRELIISDYERESVESSMVRYRYGPWDFRYRRFINILVAKSLAWVNVDGRTIEIGLTKNGIETSKALGSQSAFIDISNRARILKKHFDNKGSHLMKFIYATFPEIGTLRLGEKIEL